MKKRFIALCTILLLLPVLPAASAEIPAIPAALLTRDLHGGTVVSPESISLKTEITGDPIPGILETTFLPLDGVTGAYRITRKNTEESMNHGNPYFSLVRAGQTFAVKPNTPYMLSALIYCDFNKATSEAMLSVSDGMLVNLVSLPWKTDGWERFEKVIVTGTEVGTGAFGGSVAGGFKDETEIFCVSDLCLIELPAYTLSPLGPGEGLTFGGSSGSLGMEAAAPKVSDMAVSVTTTGAEYIFNKTNNTVTASQRIGEERRLATVQLSKSLASLTVSSQSSTEVILTTGEGGVSFGIQMDGLMLISTHGTALTATCTGEISAPWSRLLSGHLMVRDDYGGFTVNPAIPVGTGRTARCEVLDEIDFARPRGDTAFMSQTPAGWRIAWTVDSGEMLGVSVFPCREYDWEESFASTYANFSSTSIAAGNRYAAYKEDYGVTKGVLWDFTERGWGMGNSDTYTPVDEENYIKNIAAAKAAGISPVPYMSFYFWHNRNVDEYIAEVKRHRDTYGIEGVYTDGLPDKEWLESYAAMRKLRELFPDGTIIVHTTGQSANGGPPLATPEISIPAIDAYATMTLRGESVPGTGALWKYPRYMTAGYGTSSAFGVIKADGWKTAAGEAQPGESLLPLLYNGRARVTGSADFGAYRTALARLEADWRINGTDDEYYTKYFAPLAHRLVRQTLALDDTAVLAEKTPDMTSGADEISFPPVFGSLTAEYTVTVPEGGSARQVLCGADGTAAMGLSFFGGKIRVLGYWGGYRAIEDYAAGEPIAVKIEADAAEGKFRIYINEELLCENISFAGRVTNPGALQLLGNSTYGTVKITEGL